MLENYRPKLTQKQKMQIEAELDELGIKKNIGDSLSRQKLKENIEKFTIGVEIIRDHLKQKGIEFSQEEVEALIETQRSQDAMQDMINTIEILKKNGINLVYVGEKGKKQNTINRLDTIETMLENYRPELSEEQKEKIKEELDELGINYNIGYSLNNQKSKNKENFKLAVLELQEKLRQRSLEFSQEEIEILMELQRSQDPTQDIINTIKTLKKNGINLVYKNENGKIVNTIKQADTIQTMLENYIPRLTKEELGKIKEELEKLGVNENIGQSLGHRKKSNNIQKLSLEFQKIKQELEQEGIDFSHEEIEALVGRKEISKNATQDMINTIEILKKNGINLLYVGEKGEKQKTIKRLDTIETMLENYRPKLTEEQKEKIKRELEELGIRGNIGQSLKEQKTKRCIEKFTIQLENLRERLKDKGIILCGEEINCLIDTRQISKNPTEDLMKTIEILKRNGINLVYKDCNGKRVNTIQSKDTIETMLERYQNLTQEQKEKIQKEIEELGINQNIGTSLKNQKNSKNKEFFEKALKELRTQLQQEGVEFSEEEIRFLTEKSTQKKVKQTVVEQKNKGELGQNQQIEAEVFEETIRQAEQAKESEVAGR